jgi:hypothetical protein
MKSELTNLIESTEADEPNISQWCLVYDTRTGKVVHAHQFFALSKSALMSQERLEHAALAEIAPHLRKETSSFAVFHPTSDEPFEPMQRYRVDVKSGALTKTTFDPHARVTGRRRGAD